MNHRSVQLKIRSGWPLNAESRFARARQNAKGKLEFLFLKIIPKSFETNGKFCHCVNEVISKLPIRKETQG